MNIDERGASEVVALSAPEAARLGAALARQVDDAASFRDAVRRSLSCLLDDGQVVRSTAHQVVPAARTGGSESLPPPARAVEFDSAALLIGVLARALHERSPGGDLQSATRVAEVVIRMGASWFTMPGVMLREHYIEATVDMAVAVAAKSVFAPVASHR